jgi:hypothetical protein
MVNLNHIRKIGNNEFVLGELVTQLKTALGVLPFVGAGLSIPFGFKGWQEFLLTMQCPVPREQISQRIDQGQFEEAAQDLLEALDEFDFQDALSIEFGEKKLAAVTVKGAVSYLPRLTDGPTITTNFDHVLEKVFEDSGARFEAIVWGAVRTRILQKAITQNRRYLLKLHGDVEDDFDRVLTLSEYAREYSVRDSPAQIDFDKPLPRLLRLLLTTRPVLFLGCSLRNDRIVKFIKELGPPKLRPPHSRW